MGNLYSALGPDNAAGLILDPQYECDLAYYFDSFFDLSSRHWRPVWYLYFTNLALGQAVQNHFASQMVETEIYQKDDADYWILELIPFPQQDRQEECLELIRQDYQHIAQNILDAMNSHRTWKSFY